MPALRFQSKPIGHGPPVIAFFTMALQLYLDSTTETDHVLNRDSDSGLGLLFTVIAKAACSHLSFLWPTAMRKGTTLSINCMIVKSLPVIRPCLLQRTQPFSVEKQL